MFGLFILGMNCDEDQELVKIGLRYENAVDNKANSMGSNRIFYEITD